MEVKELFDYINGQLFWKIKPCVRVNVGDVAGCLVDKGYIQVTYRYRQYCVHRLIWEWHYGSIPEGYIIDHIDGNSLNNKIENLRMATDSQNQHNSKKPKNNTSGIKGVSPSRGKWKVTIYLNDKGYFFGRFDDLELAELIADEARIKLHGRYARK
jgi:hypothetical protein